MKNYKPCYRFGHDKKIKEFREFSSFDKKWHLHSVATKDTLTNKPHVYATAAVNDGMWWWTLHNN